MACAECGANKGHLLGCSQVEEQLRPAPRPVAPTLDDDDEADDGDEHERKRLWAFPSAFVLAFALVSTDLGGFIGRTCFGMWLHELGHALGAWLCGHWALPLPWFTYTFGRSLLVSLVVFGGAGALGWYGRKLESARLVVGGVTLAVVALGGHLLREQTQELLFTFAGDAGAMLLGVALAVAFLLPKRIKPLQGGLRWGWLVVGAISWADATHQWVMARRDPANLPFGTENGTASDATKLVDTFGWPEDVLVHRYLLLAGVTLALGLVAWAIAVRRAWR
jgi:hypothetical protein